MNKYPRTCWALFALGLILIFISLPHIYKVDASLCLWATGFAYGVLIRNCFRN